MKKLTAAALTAAALTVFICVGCLVAPSLARPQNSNSWTGEVYTETGTVQAQIVSDLLTPEGQTVILKHRDAAFSIPFNVTSYGGASDSGTLAAAVAPASEGWLTVAPSTTEVTVAADQNVPLTLTVTPQIPENADPGDRPDKLIFTVTFDGANTDMHAVFTLTAQSGSYAGTITDCSEFYGKTVPIVLSTDNMSMIKYNDAQFPEKTKYTAIYGENNSENVLLYDGGYVMTNSAADVVIDFSNATVTQEIKLSAGGNSYRLEYTSLPAVLEDPFILDSENKPFLSEFEMNETAPEYVVKHLGKDGNNAPIWENEARITLKKAENGSEKAIIANSGAPSGTYRINVLWKYKGVVIYERVVTIYIQNRVLMQ